jgi:hypothetical protein
LASDLQDSLVRAGLWLVVCERTVVFNLTTAPFGNHGFFGQLKDAAEEYFSSRTAACQIFQGLYEDRVVVVAVVVVAVMVVVAVVMVAVMVVVVVAVVVVVVVVVVFSKMG